jgi:hypothetical protein
LTRHLLFLDDIHRYSLNINKLVKNDQENDLKDLLENRRRLIAIATTFNNKIQAFMEDNKKLISENNTDIKTITILWEQDSKRIINEVKELDQETMRLLEQKKLKTTKEIANVFGAKTKLQGYDLTDLKK